MRHRLTQLDALRGLAAMAVVLFHYTTRFEQLFGYATPPSFSVPWGQYGVNLFFIISGLVIFMTLDRVERPMDFVVSRFSRLYPAYWVAIALTVSITAWLNLPAKFQATPTTALLNGLMFHGLFGVPHVSGVYWTLEVELLFYALMFGLLITRQLQRIYSVLLALFGLRLIYFAMARYWGIDLSWHVYHLLSLQYIAWFGLGIGIYGLLGDRSLPRQRIVHALMMGCAVLLICVVESAPHALMALALTALVLAASGGRLKILDLRPCVWLGGISYPLYLLHESIGWAGLLQLQAHAVPTDLAIALMIVCVVLLAAAVSHLVEQPALRLIRKWYRERRQPAYC